MEIISNTGQLIRNFALFEGENIIEAKDLNKGIYLIKITSQGSVMTGKILKE